MRREVALDPFRITIKSKTGYFHKIIEPGTAKEVGDAFATIVKYLKAANHAKTGLTDITLTNQEESEL
jgi:hypothetical protein